MEIVHSKIREGYRFGLGLELAAAEVRHARAVANAGDSVQTETELDEMYRLVEKETWADDQEERGNAGNR